jgi:prepilin-type N-terminal cleavage/methylation domain-containing protein/prepilin-type processing-associated H-X9-DG protein
MSKRNAFTLIELLVVVAIIALLVAILLPSLNAARAEAQRIVCMSRLKQFAYAFVYYCNDNGGQFPERSNWWDENWFVQFDKYLGELPMDFWTTTDDTIRSDIYECPADENRDVNPIGYAMPFANFVAITIRLQGISHIYEWPIARLPHNINDVRRPSDVMSFTEIWDQARNPLTPYGPNSFSTWPLDMDFDGDGVLDSNAYECYLEEAKMGYPSPYNRVAARHPGRVCNIGFVDSHVESQFVNDMLYDKILWGVELVGMKP